MKLIIKQSNLKSNETRKIMKLIYSSFILYNYEDSDQALRAKMKKHYHISKKSKARKRFLKSKILLIATIKKEIVGVIRGEKHFLRNLYIKPGNLGLGIGEKLLKSFEKKAKSYGSKAISLKASKYAEHFYIKQGFGQTSGKYLKKYM